jgi:hypothetical protein
MQAIRGILVDVRANPSGSGSSTKKEQIAAWIREYMTEPSEQEIATIAERLESSPKELRELLGDHSDIFPH